MNELYERKYNFEKLYDQMVRNKKKLTYFYIYIYFKFM